jgi:hypothetical protein
MPDKTSIGISDLLRKFIKALVKEVVIEGKPFDDQKKEWLQTYSHNEGEDYATLEKNLLEFFEAVDELRIHESKSGERLAKKVAKECYLEEGEVDNLISSVNKAREEARAEAERKEDASFKKCTNIASCDVYLKTYPQGRYTAQVMAKKGEFERIDAERKETERKVKEEARRKAEEEAKRKDEAMQKAETEAKRKAEEAERKTRNQRLLDEHPFIDFPNIRKELLNCVGAEDFYGKYYLSYEPILKEIRLIVLWVVDVLKNQDVKQSDEYSDFESKANLYLSKTQNSSCREICQEHGSIKENGELLVRRGKNMGNAVRENREKAAFKKLVRKRTWIAAIVTFVAVAIACFMAWWRIYYPDYSMEGWPIIVQILVGLLIVGYALVLFLLPFLWSKDFRNEK